MSDGDEHPTLDYIQKYQPNKQNIFRMGGFDGRTAIAQLSGLLLYWPPPITIQNNRVRLESGSCTFVV